MGSISSIHVSPSENYINDGIERRVEVISEANENAVEPFQVARQRCLCTDRENTLEIRLSHSFDFENESVSDNELMVTVQYLARENARLSLANSELTKKLEMLTKEAAITFGKTNLIDIHGETMEQKLLRTENALVSERRDKWKAIEDGERIRIDLINCQSELRAKDVEVNELQKKQVENQRTIVLLKEEVEKLKKEDVGIHEKNEEMSKSERDAKRKSEMEKFKADLMVKREIRQNALASVSSELHKLKEELEAERELRLKLEDHLKTAVNLDCINQINDMDKVKSLEGDNDRLKAENQVFHTEIQSLNSVISRIESDYKEEKMRHKKTSEEKMEIEIENGKKAKLLEELQMEKKKMWSDYDREKTEINRRTSALKDMVNISKQMLLIRESQVKELRKKLKEIEDSVNSSKLPEQRDLRAEYEKQLQNIKTLKELYEERVRLMEMEKEKLNETINQQAETIENQKNEIECLKDQCGATSEDLKKEKCQNDSLERDLRLSVAKSNDLENELSLINNMFTQMLLGPYNTGNETDLDKLTELLQENHDLITELTLRESSSEVASALPKLLLDLITQVDNDGQSIQGQEGEQDLSELDAVSERSDSIVEGAVLPILSYKKAVLFRDPLEAKEMGEKKKEEIKRTTETPKFHEHMNPAVREIASNLPKVWRVLMELLSHHTIPNGPPPGDEKQCYKYIETPSGTRSVISVSNTFIRLKDLILEKKALQKELMRLKQLNSHLEIRLDDQEKRLSHVQCELHKTWGIVGRMRAQHQQLHNQEKILRYELQEKRVMLNELKQELEYCKEKWERARQKNDESETQWQKLRREFAERKNKSYPNLNDSGESGFSDELNESGEEAENFDADRSSTESPVDRKFEATATSREASCSRDKADAVKAANAAASEMGRETTLQFENDKIKLREARLRRLEDQCQLLVKQVDVTNSKRNFLTNRLEELHEQYGTSEERGQIFEKTGGAATTDDPAGGATNQPLADTYEAEFERVEESAVDFSSSENEKLRHLPAPPDERDNRQQSRKVEEILSARSERLQRLEEQCQSLVGKVTNTVQKSKDLFNKLEDIHIELMNNERASSDAQRESPEVEENIQPATEAEDLGEGEDENGLALENSAKEAKAKGKKIESKED